MSQSDYIRHKRISYELSNQRKLPSILNSGQYVSYKEYSLENTIQNTNIEYNQLVPPNTQLVFGIEYHNALACPQFPLCEDTDKRLNRKTSVGALAENGPYVHASRPLTKKQVAATPSYNRVNTPSYTKLMNMYYCKCVA